MPTLDPRIDEHIAKAGAFARPILERFRAVVHGAVPDCVEAIKWGMPHFTLNGRNLAGMAAFKKHVSIFFHHDENPEGERGSGTGPFRQITSLDQMPDEGAIKARLEAALERFAAPAKTPKPKAALKPMPPLPDAFAKALDAQAQRERFDAMPPGYRREYIEWIVEAKTDATRDKRIAQAVELIAAGKHRNWKYQKG
ncbi:MAG: hypothetical protein RIS85_1901 [Pseudomonadota bacterium]